MRFFLILTILTSSFFEFSVIAQSQSQEQIVINENTIIKDVSGKKIDLAKFSEMVQSGEWFAAPVKDKDGKFLYMQLRESTEEERKKIAEMMLKMSSGAQADKMVGEKAPDFTIKDLNGNEISTAASKGKILVLNFWFAGCKPCVAEVPELNEVYEKYHDNPNVIFASITFDKKERATSFLKKFELKYPIVADARDICDQYKVTGYPTNLIIDHKGNYAFRKTGGFYGVGKLINEHIKKALLEKQK